MCGRFALIEPVEALVDYFDLPSAPEVKARYNIAPSQNIWGIRQNSKDGLREAIRFRWGLIPSWAKDSSLGLKMINARSETVAEKPAFRSAFKRRRCLIPASGFYEWKKTKEGKRPYFIYPSAGGIFAFGGIWESWHDPEDGDLESCSILTTSANSTIAEVHDRMPVVLNPDHFETWLNPKIQMESALQPLLRPAPESWFQMRPVSTRVNNAKHEGPDCLSEE